MSHFVFSKGLDWVRFGRRIAVLYPIAHGLGLVGLLMQAQPMSALLAWLIVDALLLVGVLTHQRGISVALVAHAIAFPMLSGDIGELFIWNLFLTPSSTVIFSAIGAWAMWATPSEGAELPSAVSNCLLSALVFVVIAIQGVHHSWVEQAMRGTEFLAALFVSLVICLLALWMARGSRIATVVGWGLLGAGMIFAAQDGGWIDWVWLMMSSTIWCLAYLAVVSVWGAFSAARLPVEHHPRPLQIGYARFAGRGLATAMLLVLAMRFVVEDTTPNDEQLMAVDHDAIVNSQVVADDEEGDFSEAFGGVASADKKGKIKSEIKLKPGKRLNVDQLKAIERAGIQVR